MSRRSHKSDDEDEFVAKETESSDSTEWSFSAEAPIIVPETRKRSQEINYSYEPLTEEEEDKESEKPEFKEEEEKEEDFMQELGYNNGKIDRIYMTREYNDTLEYLLLMQGQRSPLSQWIPDTLIREIPNYKGCITRFNETPNPFSFYICEEYQFSTDFDSPLHILSDKPISENSDTKIYLFQMQTVFGNIYYWENYTPATHDVIEKYEQNKIRIKAEIPGKRPDFDDAKIKNFDDPEKIQYFKSKHGFFPRN